MSAPARYGLSAWVRAVDLAQDRVRRMGPDRVIADVVIEPISVHDMPARDINGSCSGSDTVPGPLSPGRRQKFKLTHDLPFIVPARSGPAD